MKIALITNYQERKGLYRDATILSGLLKEYNHEPIIIDFRDAPVSNVRLVIFLEVAEPKFMVDGAEYWWIPNPEWAGVHLQQIPRFSKILCKTKISHDVFSKLSQSAVFVGFMSEDHYDGSVKRERVFFHAYRGSENKGTKAIRDAWKHLRIQQPLIIAEDFDEKTLWREQNRCLFHLCPSEYEGWGHSIHEALSVGAVICTTNIQPMNQIDGIANTIPTVSTTQRHKATTGIVSPEGIADAVKWCTNLSGNEIERLSSVARQSFRKECDDFKVAFYKLMAEI